MTSASMGWSAEMELRAKMIKKDPVAYIMKAKRGELEFGDKSIIVSNGQGRRGSAGEARRVK